jgi:uncharacterized protein (DUF1501 family)
VGTLAGFGLTLGDFLHARSASAAPGDSPAAESVILVFLDGGMSHLDSFDPKPYAPIEYRGELGTVPTASGDLFSGLFPGMAQAAGKLAVIRSLTHGEAAHERGKHNMLTGYRPSPAINYPSQGAVVSYELGSRKDLPPYVCIPSASEPWLGTGYLGTAFGPFSVGGEPADEGFQVRDLSLPPGVDEKRMEGRKTLLSEVDRHFAGMERSDSLSAMDTYYQRAYSLISSQAAREAFQISAEPPEIRDEYGRTAMGQRLLLARRLVEAGVRFVTVMDGGWDLHKSIKDGMNGKAPPLDKAMAALLNDLDRRGSLAKTLVILSTEFGRTVRLNKDAGRDHWPKAFSVVLAGGGIKGGVAYGSTDARGSEPKDKPVSPESLAATLYHQIGIDPSKRIMSSGNRPVAIVRDGNVIQELV